MSVSSLLVCALCLVWPQAQKAHLDPTIQRVEQTRVELAKGQFSPQSRALLETALGSPNEGVAMDAETKLQWAVQLGKYPKAKLLRLVEARSNTARFWWGVLLAGEYGRTLGLKIVGDPTLDREALALAGGHEPANRLTPQDRALVNRCLAAPTLGGRIDSLYALFPKQGLSKPDLAWARSRLHAQAASHSGAERQLWEYAERVTTRRSEIRPARVKKLR